MRSSLVANGMAVFLLAFFAQRVYANVVIGGTRVVFPAQDGEVTIRLTNDSGKPALVESWIDKGDMHATPDKVHTPFLITPPLFRMDAHKDQSLRILFAQAIQPLPNDRESLFWLNVLEIPPRPTGPQTAGKNLLQFAIRSRLKLFYRPSQLTGDPNEAPAQVTWQAVADGQGYALEVHNPTPYHVTIAKASLEIGGKRYVADAGMVDPMGVLRLTVKGLATAPAADTPISYDIVNDYGAMTTFQGTVTP